ncbi:MAG TPA: Flp family type IVb pilin [Tepidisphaeraceae bacterium]|jgi:pilus assembly protein Flp/PilA
MRALVKGVEKFVRDEQGTEALEWGLICGLVVVGAITAMTFIGPKVTKIWNDVNSAVSKVP